MSKEHILAELDRLLDAGEPLLNLFPKEYPDHHQLQLHQLQLPDGISHNMSVYANQVAWRASASDVHKDFWRKGSVTLLTDYIEVYKAGLSGWRAIGVLK